MTKEHKHRFGTCPSGKIAGIATKKQESYFCRFFEPYYRVKSLYRYVFNYNKKEWKIM